MDQKPSEKMDQKPSEKMDEFLDKVDKLCWEYHYEIYPTEGYIRIIGEKETIKLLYIDGDGRGK